MSMQDTPPGDRSHAAPRGSSLGCLVGPMTAAANPEEVTMLWTIFVVLLVLWLLGVVTSYTLGGFIHLLLIVAIVLAVLQVLQGRRVM